TVEAINHAKAAKVPIVVAINKIDKPTANVDKIKQILTEHGLVTEEWGGDTMMIPISAKQGTGIDNLLEKILLLAEVNDYKANPDRKAMGTIIEAKLDKGKGPVATIIVQNGTLNSGDMIVSGMVFGRIRAMHDDKGRIVKTAGPSTAVQIQGLHGVPNAGDVIHVVEDEKLAKQVAEERTSKMRGDLAAPGSKVTLDDMFSKMSESILKVYNVIIKADVQGSAEAIKQSLVKLANEEVRLNVVHSGVGAINKSDMMLAEVSNATVIGFNVRPDAESKQIAESSKINIRLHSIIFEVIDDVTATMTGMIEPKYKEVPIGKAEVRNVFKITGSGIVAGSYVLDGKIQRNCKVNVMRDEKVVHEGTVTTLKRFKEDVKDIAAGYECGISVDGGFAVNVGDVLECFILERIN
ncbi:MAG: translation initiation factor IF-2, partial [Firmicutes bacterium]|nr:translation initiation factor IF-2 [Bacillota bacterium]